MNLNRVGVDLSKNVFQLHGVDDRGKVVLKKRLPRSKWFGVLCESLEPGCEVGIDACGGALHWTRQLEALGYAGKDITIET